MTRLIRTSSRPIASRVGKSTTRLEPPCLIVVDSQPSDYAHLSPVFAEHGVRLVVFQTAAELMYVGLPESLVCVLVNLELPDMAGLELCESIRRRHRDKPIFLVAEQYDALLESEVLASGIGQLACKPIHALWLRDSVFWQRRLPARQRTPLEATAVVHQPQAGDTTSMD